jgi:magnesium transporter
VAVDLALSETYVGAHPADAARVLERLPAEDVAPLLNAMRPGVVADVIERMVPTVGAECLTHLSTETAAVVMEQLVVETAAAILRQLPLDRRTELLDSLGAAAAALRALLTYDEGTAGSIMDPRALALPDDITAGDALVRVKRTARRMLYYLYVVDRDHQLVGVLDVAELMQARPSDRLTAVMRQPVVAVHVAAGRTAILAHPGWAELHALPVIDDRGALVGAIRYQTFRRMQDGEAGRPPESLATVFALGELCWVGLSALLRELTPGGDPPGSP